MGYFPNGSSADYYERRYCNRCIHGEPDTPCAVWDAHTLHNYDDCNNPDSILHILIPRCPEGLTNQQCRMYVKNIKTKG